MEKKDWLEIKDKFPKTLERCATHFKHHFGEQWKSSMRDPELLKQWLWNKGIVIETKAKNGIYKHHLILPGFGQHDHEEAALIQAFKHAFEVLENEF